jgi:hypothetical protein
MESCHSQSHVQTENEADEASRQKYYWPLQVNPEIACIGCMVGRQTWMRCGRFLRICGVFVASQTNNGHIRLSQKRNCQKRGGAGKGDDHVKDILYQLLTGRRFNPPMIGPITGPVTKMSVLKTIAQAMRLPIRGPMLYNAIADARSFSEKRSAIHPPPHAMGALPANPAKIVPLRGF